MENFITNGGFFMKLENPLYFKTIIGGLYDNNDKFNEPHEDYLTDREKAEMEQELFESPIAQSIDI